MGDLVPHSFIGDAVFAQAINDREIELGNYESSRNRVLALTADQLLRLLT